MHAMHLENNKLPVRPVDVRSKHRHWEQIYVGHWQYNLPALTCLKVDPLDLICAGVAPV